MINTDVHCMHRYVVQYFMLPHFFCVQLPTKTKACDMPTSSANPIILDDFSTDRAVHSVPSADTLFNNYHGLLAFTDDEMRGMISTMDKMEKVGGFGEILIGEVRHTQVAVKLVTKVNMVLSDHIEALLCSVMQ